MYLLMDINLVCCYKFWRRKRSVLGPLLFLLHINDLNEEIKLCRVHHFCDGSNLLYLRNSIKNLNKLVNADLKHLVNWLIAKIMSFNLKIAQMVIFKSKQQKFEANLKIYSVHCILKFQDKICSENILFVRKFLKNFSSDQHNY